MNTTIVGLKKDCSFFLQQISETIKIKKYLDKTYLGKWKLFVFIWN